MGKLTLNMEKGKFPVLSQYPTERVIEMVVEILVEQGETAETMTENMINSTVAILESDLQHMFP